MKLYKLKDVATITTGRTPSKATDDYYIDGQIPFVKPPNLKSPRPITETAEYINDKGRKYANIIPKNSIMVSCIGILGKVGIAGKDLTTNQQINSLTFNEKLVHYKYGYYCALNLGEKLRNISNAAVVPIVNKSSFSELEIPVPTLEEQIKIVEILDKAELLRQKRKKSVGLLDDYLASKFEEMFGNLRLNPKNWKKYSLKDITSKITDGTHQSPKFVESGIPFIFISNIVQNEINLNTKKYISEQTYHELTKSTPIEKYDILYTTVGSYGHPAIVKTDERFCFQRHIAHIKPDASKTNVYFLYGMLKTPYVRQQADERAKGVAQKTLNLGELSKLQVILPPMEMQNEYADVVAKVESIKQSMLKQSVELDNQFHALIQKAFN